MPLTSLRRGIAALAALAALAIARPAVALDQWANSVIAFSTQWSDPSYGAIQVLGEPNVAAYGDSPNAWCPSTAGGGTEFLTVSFATPVNAVAVTIRETWGYGFVTKVETLDTSNVYRQVWTGTDTSVPDQINDFRVNFPLTNYLVRGVRVTFNTALRSGWEEVDAIALHGGADVTAPTVRTTAPALGAALKSLPAIKGTVEDAGGSLLSSLHVRLKRVSDGKFWNGATLTWGAEHDLTVSLADSPNWTVTEALPSGGNLTDGAYYVLVRALDGAGNVRHSNSAFIVDKTLPSLTFTTPTSGSIVTELTSIEGTAADAGSGIKAVYARIKRLSDNKHWNGTGWQTAAVNLVTNHSSPWIAAANLPSSADLPPGNYSLIGLAYDRAGNLRSVVIRISVP